MASLVTTNLLYRFVLIIGLPWGLWGCTTPPPPNLSTLHLQQKTVPSDTLTPAELALLQPGDVLLRRGYGLVSDYILAVLQEPLALTHCGLVVRQADGGWGILHTGSTTDHEGVLIEPLLDFVHQSQAPSLVAVRPNITPQQRQHLLQLAQEYALAAAPFDYSFDDQNSDALYCVELLRDLLLAVCQQDYLPVHYHWNDQSLLGFQGFMDSTRFTPLFNHYQTAS